MTAAGEDGAAEAGLARCLAELVSDAPPSPQDAPRLLALALHGLMLEQGFVRDADGPASTAQSVPAHQDHWVFAYVLPGRPHDAARYALLCSVQRPTGRFFAQLRLVNRGEHTTAGSLGLLPAKYVSNPEAPSWDGVFSEAEALREQFHAHLLFPLLQAAGLTDAELRRARQHQSSLSQASPWSHAQQALWEHRALIGWGCLALGVAAVLAARLHHRQKLQRMLTRD